MWTQSWRRLNKKGKEEGVQRKRLDHFDDVDDDDTVFIIKSLT